MYCLALKTYSVLLLAKVVWGKTNHSQFYCIFHLVWLHSSLQQKWRGAKVAKSLNVEVGINVEGGKKLVHNSSNKREVEGGKKLGNQ